MQGTYGMQNTIDAGVCASEDEGDGDNLSPHCRLKLKTKRENKQGSSADELRALYKTGSGSGRTIRVKLKVSARSTDREEIGIGGKMERTKREVRDIPRSV